ncbi:MAG: ketoacyl-ACP synthase III [Firmicutes bacterium]|nr:ketoacyl-ACP synthase III [Bacillota bacterium]
MALSPLAVRILGLGAAVPSRTVTNDELAKHLETSDSWIRSHTGIVQRHLLEAEQATSDLAVQAANEALRESGVAADAIDLIIVCTVTPDMATPATASLVQERIGATHAAAFDLSAGCSGFLYGLITAAQFIVSGSCRSVLVIGAETLSRVVNWKDRNTCVLFGDGAGAALLTPAQSPLQGIHAFDFGSDGAGASALCIPMSGSRRPPTPEGLLEGAQFLHMDGHEVYRFGSRVVPESALAVLRDAQWTIDDIDLFVAHQANGRLISTIADRIGIPSSKCFVNIDRYANTSSASIPLALKEAQEQGRIHPGDRLLLSGFGAGLTWASMLLVW